MMAVSTAMSVVTMTVPMTALDLDQGAVLRVQRCLFEAISRAETRDAGSREFYSEQELIKAKIATLTPREREVWMQVVAGRLNKQIAGDLGIVEKTTKVHRKRVMEKLGVRNLTGT